jgi:hypothetical protein
MRYALILALLAGCGAMPAQPPANWPATPRQVIEPPAVVEASCPSPLLFDKEPLGGWKSMYENCRDTVFSLKR